MTSPEVGIGRFSRPVKADALFASPEMQLRYPGEVERSREGTDEGVGRGFDDMDPSAGVSREIMSSDPASAVVAWFVENLGGLGWRDVGDGRLERDFGESFGIRIDWEHARSPIADKAVTDEGRELVQRFQGSLFADVPDDCSVVRIFYIVSAENKR
jgi:hypothetical protein